MTYRQYAVVGRGADRVVRPYDGTSGTPSPTRGETRTVRNGTSRTPSPTRLVIARSEATRQSVFLFRADSHASVRRGTWAPPYGARRSCGADRDVRRDGISAGTRAVEHQGTHRGGGAASRDSASRKAVEAQSFEPEKTGKPVARGTGQREIIADAREEVLKRSFKRRFW